MDARRILLLGQGISPTRPPRRWTPPGPRSHGSRTPTTRPPGRARPLGRRGRSSSRATTPGRCASRCSCATSTRTCRSSRRSSTREAGRQLEQQIGNCTITSLADVVAPSLAGPCLDDDLAAVLDGDSAGGPGVPRRRGGDRAAPGHPAAARARARERLPAAVRPQRRAAVLRRRRPRPDPDRRDDRRRHRARAGADRRVLRLGQDAGHGGSEPRRSRTGRSGSSWPSRSACSSRCCSPRRSPAASSSG